MVVCFVLLLEVAQCIDITTKMAIQGGKQTAKTLELNFLNVKYVFVVLGIDVPCKVAMSYQEYSGGKSTDQWINSSQGVFCTGNNPYAQIHVYLEKSAEIRWVAGSLMATLCDSLDISTNFSVVDVAPVANFPRKCYVDGLARSALTFAEHTGTWSVPNNYGANVYTPQETEFKGTDSVVGMYGIVYGKPPTEFDMLITSSDPTDDVVLESVTWNDRGFVENAGYYNGLGESVPMNAGSCTSFQCDVPQEPEPEPEPGPAPEPEPEPEPNPEVPDEDQNNPEPEPGPDDGSGSEGGQPAPKKSNKGKAIAAAVCVILLVLILMITGLCLYGRERIPCAVVAVLYFKQKGWQYAESSSAADQAPAKETKGDQIEECTTVVQDHGRGIIYGMIREQSSSVVATTSSSTCASIASNDLISKWNLRLPDEGNEAWVQLKFESARVCVESYTVKVIGDTETPWFWQLEGSNNGTDWTLLDQRHARFTGLSETMSCNVWSYTLFKYIRFKQTMNSARGNALNLDGLEFYGQVQSNGGSKAAQRNNRDSPYEEELSPIYRY